jgi:nucleoside 2-deoxyribosyltransferase
MSLSIYFASALFNARETVFNYELAARLERKHFVVRLPQRDGFEFGALRKMLAEEVSPQELATAVEAIIYTLDMGVFLTRSDAVVAVLDEPLDEGVLIEIAFARQLGIPVVGVRTDVRAPFGKVEDPLGGIHFFAAFQCTEFIMASPILTAKQFDLLAATIAKSVRSVKGGKRRTKDPTLQAAAKQLLAGLDIDRDNIHMEKNLSRIVRNYRARPELFLRLAPRTVQQRG